ncbi:MAG: YihY/virulence factor BrkB family protein [Hyphomicrobiaceae bacterium]
MVKPNRKERRWNNPLPDPAGGEPDVQPRRPGIAERASAGAHEAEIANDARPDGGVEQARDKPNVKQDQQPVASDPLWYRTLPPIIQQSVLQQAYETTRPKTLLAALYRTYEHSGFTMAGAVAFSFVLALFPFCIFLGAIAGVFGGHELADRAVAKLFEVLPPQVAGALAPQVDAVLGRTRVDLITIGGAVALFFATNGIETLRNALNFAYREQETRPYPLCLLISAGFVIFNAVGSLLITWLTLVVPVLAAQFEPDWLKPIHTAGWWDAVVRYGIAAMVIGALLLVAHLFLAAGHRTLEDVWPGVVVSVVLWLGVATLYSYYLSFADYSRFYAGLSQIMIALIFFQVTAIIIILGAEFNRGLMELKRFGYIREKD